METVTRNRVARIDELSLPPNRISADQVLRNAGYLRIGSGGYAAVYHKPGAAYVLKVFAASDAPYIEFLKLAQAHQDNPHFPKFKGKMVKVTPVYNAIRMEKLSPYKHDETHITNYIKYRDAHAPAGSWTAEVLDNAMETMEYNPSLKEACDLIIDNLPFNCDMKRDNIMMRGDTLVIIDPVNVPDAPTEVLPYVHPYEEPEPQTSVKRKWSDEDEELLRQLDGLTEARKRSKKETEPAQIHLEYGRSIFPKPKNERWENVGAPMMMRLSDLDLHPDGLSTARSAAMWSKSYEHTNDKPISITYVDGLAHVLDKYHRVVNAAGRGESEIMVQVKE